MATVAGLDWSRSDPLSSHHDVPQPLFPERRIQPLPKRRLRSRLSEEEANSIGRPLDPSSSPSVFSSPGAQRDSTFRTSQFGDSHAPQAADFHYSGAPGAYESDEDREDEHRVGQRPSWTNDMLRYPRGSTASSVDGESFENTNNKKKRKIPVQHSSSFPVDANDSDTGATTGSWQLDGAHNPYSVGKSVPSNARVRAHRNVSRGKPPLSTSLSGMNSGEAFDGNAASRAKPSRVSCASGQENNRFSPHQQSVQQVNQFTFNYPSDSSKQLNQATKVGMAQAPLTSSHASRTATTHGTQTTHSNMTSNQRPQPAHLPQGQAAPPAPTQQENVPSGPTLDEQLHQQAVNRRHMNRRELRKRNELSRDDVYICQFCLYEAVYGEKPRHLIRQFEAKELRQSQEREERKRLLEKAKAKSRKTRKAGRSSQVSKGSGAHTNPAPDQAPYDAQCDPGQEPQSPGEEFFDEYDDAGDYGEGYDEEYPPSEPAASPPPNTLDTSASPASLGRH